MVNNASRFLSILTIFVNLFGCSARLYKADLLQCSITNFPNSPYFQSEAIAYHGSTANMCGGDPGQGLIRIKPATNYIEIKMGTLAHTWNLYTVFWLPIGGVPDFAAGDLRYIGEFFTKGTAALIRWRTVRHNSAAMGTSPADLTNSAYSVDFTTAVANHPEAGQFLLYSRGPVKTDPDSTGRLTWNTDDRSWSGTLVNVPMWTNTTAGFIQQWSGGRGPQFISGVSV